MENEIKTIDIIIPTYGPGERFLRLFEMLLRQTVPFGRLIIINTEREKMPAGIRERLLGEERVLLKDIPAEEFDHAGTRAYGVRLSDADAFICMTDDAIPADIYLIEKLAASLEEEGTALAYARQLAAGDADEAEKYVRRFNYPDESRVKSIADLDELGIKTYFASNVCCAYRRSIYDSLGGFQAPAVFNEDMVYAAAALQAGYRAVYNAGAKVIHSHNYTAAEQFHRNFDLGMSQSMHPEVFAGLRSEGEGMKLVKNTVRHLAVTGHIADIPVFIVRTAFRYAGFRAGRAYDRLSGRMLVSFAMNKRFAEKLAAERSEERNGKKSGPEKGQTL